MCVYVFLCVHSVYVCVYERQGEKNQIPADI